MARRPGALVVAPGGLTAEEKKKNDLEKAAACRKRIVLDRQSRERAAVGLEAAKRARLGGKEDDGGAKSGVGRRQPYVWSGSGKVKQVPPGPPCVYALYGTNSRWRQRGRQRWCYWKTRGVRYRRQQIGRKRRIGLQRHG